jgi:MYXO-CTERM domain-containing protein
VVAFGFGLAAIFTPCVFPMSPITVSFFLGDREVQAGEHRTGGGLLVGIVVLFSSLGWRRRRSWAFGVVQLGSSPW